jgi:Pyruvate/2-oxoacid:ferredoxin oxidoreductase gamma subunit
MALIRCNSCGNLASSKTANCPICGAPIATAEQKAQPTAAEPKVEANATPVVEPKAESAPRTLNDILRERSAQTTLGDSYLDQKSEESPAKEDTAVVVPPVVSTPEAPTPAGGDNGGNGGSGDYNDNVIDDYEAEIARHKRTSNGFMLCAIIAIVLLIPAAYFSITLGMQKKTIEDNLEIVESARRIFEDENSMLQRNAEDLVTELEGLKDQNDTMMLKYQEAVVMLEQLQREKTYNYEQLAKYKKEVATLRNVMKGYLRQIDSLNTINSNLQAQNIQYKKEINTAQLRADVAEEKADELNTKVRIGSVIQASGIRMTALNAKSNEVKRMRLAKRLKVDFDLTANELAEPGEKSVYLRILGPDGYLLAPSEVILFSFEGDEMRASAVRKVDYENESVPVSIFYDGETFTNGTYTVEIYVDGRLSGSKEIYFDK